MAKEKELLQEIDKLKKQLEIANNRVKTANYGVVWMDVPEAFENETENQLPVLNEIKRGKALAKSLAGETTLAATLTESVARATVNMAMTTTQGVSKRPISLTGSHSSSSLASG